MTFMDNEGYRMKTLCQDKGTAYDWNGIKYQVKTNGILHPSTHRAAHAVMHVTERMKSKLVEMESYMLRESGLRKQWWGHMEIYAKKIRKRHKTSNFNNKESPYGRFFNKILYPNIVKLLGCTALI